MNPRSNKPNLFLQSKSDFRAPKSTSRHPNRRNSAEKSHSQSLEPASETSQHCIPSRASKIASDSQLPLDTSQHHAIHSREATNTLSDYYNNFRPFGNRIRNCVKQNCSSGRPKPDQGAQNLWKLQFPLVSQPQTHFRIYFALKRLLFGPTISRFVSHLTQLHPNNY